MGLIVAEKISKDYQVGEVVGVIIAGGFDPLTIGAMDNKGIK